MNIESLEPQNLDQMHRDQLIAEPLGVADGVEIDQDSARGGGLEERSIEKANLPKIHDSSESPIGVLPADILESIFTTCLLHTDRHSSPHWHPAVTATHVCREWRAIALSRPLLWTRIDISFDMDELWESCIKLHNIDTSRAWGPNEAFYLSYLALCSQRITSTAARANAFIERSLTCPLDLSVIACDLHSVHFAGMCKNNRVDSIFTPIHEVLRRPSLQWGTIDTYVRVASASGPFPSAMLLSNSPAAGHRHPTLRSFSLDLACDDGSTLLPDQWWKCVEASGKLTIAEGSNLDFLKLRMDHVDICRICAPYSNVTVVDFGSPRRRVSFLPHEAIHFLQRLPNLLKSTIHLSTSPGEPVPPLPSVRLPKLKSMILLGDLPPVAFAAALDLPSLIHVCTANTFAWPIQEIDTSVMGEWCRRYGKQLTQVGIGTGSLTPEALIDALEQLPNVMSLNLARSPFLLHPSYEGSSHSPTIAIVGSWILRKLTPGTAEACLCPNLEALTCAPYMELRTDTMESLLHLIEMRRKPTGKVGRRVRWLERVIVSAHSCPVDDFMVWLQSRGVDARGIEFENVSLEDAYNTIDHLP